MKWINVKEMLPEKGCEVLCIIIRSHKRMVAIAKFYGQSDDLFNEWGHLCGAEPPTHWMPLPEIPNEMD